MSYDIIYNKQFIKTDDERYVPILLSGSNNCYQTNYNGREIRERSWNNHSYMLENILSTKEELIQATEDFRNSLNERYEDYKDDKFGYSSGMAKYGSSFNRFTFKQYQNIFLTGIKNAATIEELFKEDVHVSLNVSFYSKEKIEEQGLEVLPDVTFTSTQHMIETIEKYEKYYNGTQCYLSVRFNNEYSIKRFLDYKRIRKPRRQKERKDIDCYYVITNEQDHFFVKYSKYGYKYNTSTDSYYVKKFETEKKAEAFRKRMRSSNDWFVAKVNKKTTILV